MPRTARASVGGTVYHAINRDNARAHVSRKPGDYETFIRLWSKANNACPCVNRGTPFGSPRWNKATANRPGLESTLRPCGRPREKPIG